VNETQFEYVTPEAIASDPVTKDVYDETMQLLQGRYDFIRAGLIQKYVKDGMDEKAAEKKANEDARMILPNACCTSIVLTMNIRSLFNFFKHRCCNRAQWEIRDVADEMLRQCMEVAPNIFKYAGPDCVTKGKCSEGKMSCGNPKFWK
jgi:thymidylate synthase (FAD)